MPTRISPLADVHPHARLGNNVEVGPFCRIGPNVQLGDGCILDSHVVIVGNTAIGARNRFWPQAVIGAEPQDVSYRGADTRLEIGDDNVFREGVTVNRGAEKEDGVTRIGNRNMLMANCHVAHNCRLFDRTILINGVLLGGHVHVHDGAIVSGNSAVHHFATLGTLSFVGGCSRVTRDIPPYMMAS
ncbi:MAG: acyl-ACP--UDP-N-acetylglucosamine O-acyltransferase, partial [Planctomycetaceae bacterium]